jgi:hypothetical protein
VDPRIPYTSHNSSACIAARANGLQFDQLAQICRGYLRQESVAGSDAGLCIIAQAEASPAVQAFGQSAKAQVLDQAAAFDMAQSAGLWLEGLTGDGGGVIGALAAVGLRATGNDGRFIWLEGMRDLDGVYTAEQLCQLTRIDDICSLNGESMTGPARIDVTWARPVMRQNRAVLLVEPVQADPRCDWRVAPKEIIKQLSN